jgi:hypothetical protein
MSLDKITKKKVLKETIPEVLLPEDSSIGQPALGQEFINQEFVNNETPIDSLVDELTSEIEEWNDLINEANTELSNVVVPVPDEYKDIVEQDQFTIADIQNWLLTGNTIWPDMVVQYEEHHWNNGNSILGILYGTLLEVKQELENSLSYLANSVNRPNILPEIRDVHRDNLYQAQTLRDRIRRALDRAKNKLPECAIRKIARMLHNMYGSKARSGIMPSSSLSSIVSSKQDFIDVIRAARAIIRYSVLKDKVNWKSTRRNLLNRFVQLLAIKALEEVASVVGQLQSKLNDPLINLLTNVVDLINDPDCDAFDELIGIIIEEARNLRFDYVSKIYELEKEIYKKYEVRGLLVDLADKNITMNKHLATLDIILESLDTILSSGSLDEQMVQYVKGRLAKSK